MLSTNEPAAPAAPRHVAAHAKLRDALRNAAPVALTYTQLAEATGLTPQIVRAIMGQLTRYRFPSYPFLHRTEDGRYFYSEAIPTDDRPRRPGPSGNGRKKKKKVESEPLVQPEVMEAHLAPVRDARLMRGDDGRMYIAYPISG